jgi:hypothetical protein
MRHLLAGPAGLFGSFYPESPIGIVEQTASSPHHPEDFTGISP